MDDTDLDGWGDFAIDIPVGAAHTDDDALFASFAETENLKPKISLQELKAKIEKEQSVALREVAAFNATPQQTFTATRYANGFTLARY